MSQHRRAYRRRDGQVLTLLALWIVLVPFLMWVSWPAALGALSFIGPLGLVLYLFGPAASVVVSQDSVVVRNTFNTWRVARSLIVFPNPDGTVDTDVKVTGHPSVGIAAFETAFNSRPVARGLTWFDQTLAEIGQLPDDGRRRAGVRWSSVVITFVVVGAWIWGYQHFAAG